jgi:hypothetical protein
MPHRRSPTLRSNAPPSLRGKVRQRYDQLEARRTELMARLGMLDENGRRHPGYKRALTLLNATFRKSKLPQRLAVLQAAAWLINVLEQVTMML